MELYSHTWIRKCVREKKDLKYILRIIIINGNFFSSEIWGTPWRHPIIISQKRSYFTSVSALVHYGVMCIWRLMRRSFFFLLWEILFVLKNGARCRKSRINNRIWTSANSGGPRRERELLIHAKLSARKLIATDKSIIPKG